MIKVAEFQHDMEGVKEEMQLPSDEIVAQLVNDPNIIYELLERDLLPPEQAAVAIRHIVEDGLWDNREEYA